MLRLEDTTDITCGSSTIYPINVVVVIFEEASPTALPLSAASDHLMPQHRT